jgi:hypothetical protein
MKQSFYFFLISEHYHQRIHYKFIQTKYSSCQFDLMIQFWNENQKNSKITSFSLN